MNFIFWCILFIVIAFVIAMTAIVLAIVKLLKQRKPQQNELEKMKIEDL